MIGRLLVLGGLVAGAAAAAGAAILGRRTAGRRARAERKAERLAKRARRQVGQPGEVTAAPTTSLAGAGFGAVGTTVVPPASAAVTSDGAPSTTSGDAEVAATGPEPAEAAATSGDAEVAATGPEPTAEGLVSARTGFQSIRGIGPALEARLREAGVTSIAQMAAWSNEDVETLAPVLNVSPERIRSQAWVEQAQRLLEDQAAP